ncbi:MAG: transporter substrate-binding domain-containing protein [Lachnospiraceae bacterium]|nr:transporter substrate-binding domain-containing protein [Lachnospiraceae bacterium]
MAIKNKLLTVLAVFVILLIFTGAGAFKGDTVTRDAADISKVNNVGGVESGMPENSAMVFCGSTLGKTLSGYNAYKNMDETLFALKSGEVDAIWACDVTADYLKAKDPALKSLPVSEMSDIQNTENARFEFGMALKDTEEAKKLKGEIDRVLQDMKNDGALNELTALYISGAPWYDTEEGKEKRLYPDDIRSKSGKETIYVGITGAVPPIECVDEDGEPYGFCVALMDEIGARLSKRIKFVVLDNETAFTSLMKGRVDLIFAYGTGEITTESKKKFITTAGYYPMSRYEFLMYVK